MTGLRDQRRRLRATLLLGSGAFAAAVAVAVLLTGAMRVPELDTIDARFAIRGAEERTGDVVVVGIDDASIQKVGTFPVPRSLHADVIDELVRARAAAIAYDVQFTEETVPEEDNALIDAVGRANGRVVLATTEVSERGETRVLGGDPTLRTLGARAAHGRLVTDEDGVNRRMPYSEGGLESLPVAAVEVASGRSVTRDRFDADGTAWIDYLGPAGTVPTYSFADVAEGRIERARFRNKIVVVGASAPTLQDLHPTPFSATAQMPGPEIQANAIATLRRDLPLREAPTWLGALLTALVAFVAPLGTLRLGPGRGLAVGLLLAALYAGLAQLLFGAGLIIPVVAPLAAVALSVTGVLGFSYAVAAFERERVRDLFTRFVPASVVDEVLASTNGDLGLTGKRVQATVVFCDIRGFTGFAERVPAEQVIETLNHYLDEMGEAIRTREGTIVAYQGDGILAAFGMPIEQIDHADRALDAVRDMAGPRLARVNAWMRERGLGDGFAIGIGVNSGIVMSGNVGSAWRLEYTAVGDTVNTASRLESMTKDTPHAVLISDTTRAMLRVEVPGLRYVDAVTVRGKAVKANLWTLT